MFYKVLLAPDIIIPINQSYIYRNQPNRLYVGHTTKSTINYIIRLV